MFSANYRAVTEVATYVGSGVYQRSDAGHVSRQAGFVERGHVIDGDNVGGIALKVDERTERERKKENRENLLSFVNRLRAQQVCVCS